jgi:predicted  nucleic acid-binding Zn-ribbon protein
MMEGFMYDQLAILLQLQEIDDEIDKLESEKARVPVELRALEAELAKYRERFQAKSDALEELQRERRSKDRQLNVQQAQLEKYKSQRLSVKTNKEYDALESEIAELAGANSAIEDEILELMISIDEADDEIEVARNELKAQEDIFKKKRDESLSEVKKLDRQVAEWNEKRDGFLGQIDPALMSRYDNWRKRRGSSLVAVIEGESCGGCHLKLPPQLINEVRKKKELHTCNSCGRILYWKEEEEVD